MSAPTRPLLAFRAATSALVLSAAVIITAHEALWAYQASICDAFGQNFRQSPSSIAAGFAVSISPWVVVAAVQLLRRREPAGLFDVWRALSAGVAVWCVLRWGMFRLPVHDAFYCNSVMFVPGFVEFFLGAGLALCSIIIATPIVILDWMRRRARLDHR